MEQYNVTGMSCAACSTRVEKAVSAVPGVTSCAVSLLTNSMGVEGTAAPEAIIAAVEKRAMALQKKARRSRPPLPLRQMKKHWPIMRRLCSKNG